MTDWIADEVEALFPQLVSWRRELHRYPESGWTEYRTSAFIASKLREWGWKVYLGREAVEPSARYGVPESEYLHECEQRAIAEGVNPEEMELMQGGFTGVVAEWVTGRPGPVTALRFDIDSNEIEEAEDIDHFPAREGFRSCHSGLMHACGHDGHTAIGLGLARLLSQNEDNLAVAGIIRLLFQPSEEGSRGALAMVEKGWLEDVDCFLGGHIGFGAEHLGEIVLNATHFYATTKWDALLRGQAAHAGREPEKGKNALLAAATAVLNLHAITQHSDGVSRLNVGRLSAGSGRNIIPAEAWLQLETRGETEEVNSYLSQEAERILRAAAQMYDLDLEIKKMGEAVSAVGSMVWDGLRRQALAHGNRIELIRDSLALGASEDVTLMINKVQEHDGLASYFLFGTPVKYGHHHQGFDFDEKVLAIALEGLARVVGELNRSVP